MKPESEKLNPKVREVEIGIRAFRKIKIYRLSVHDELEVSDIIDKGVAEFFAQAAVEADSENPTTLMVGAFFVKQIKDNITRILTYVTDCETVEDAKVLLKEIDNEQLVDIIDIIYTENFEVMSKKLKGFLERAGETFGLRRPSQESASITPIN